MISNFNQKLARWAGLLGAVLVAVWLVAVPVLSAANAPRVSVEPIPAGLTAAEWAGIQSQITQTTYLKASNTGVNDEFGRFVATDGDTLVLTAYMEDSNATGINGDQNNNLAANSGAAYVFVREGDSWVQQAYLKASNTGAGELFGRAVAISGDTIVIGAPWENSNATGVNGDGNNDLAPEAGAAYVFVRDGETWSQQAYLKASNTGAGDRFGIAVVIDGDTIAIGAAYEDSNATGINNDQSNNSAADAGAAYVFVREGATWTQQAYLKASNTDTDDWFGNNVAVDGDTLLVVARREASNATGINGDQTNNSAFEAGAGYVFVRNGTEWSQQAYLKASNTQAGDRFGYGVVMENDTIIIGALSEDSNATGVNGDQNNNLATDSGAAYVFHRTGAIWSQQAYLKASNTGAFDEFGLSVDISGDLVAIGTYGEDSNATGINGDQSNNAASNSGAVYLFERSGGAWSQIAYIKTSNAAAGDEFGRAVLSNNTLLAGARFEDSNATGINGNQSNNSATNSGAGYVFEITRPITGLVAINDSPTIWGNLTHLTATVSGGNHISYTWDLGDGTLVNGDVVSHTYPAIGVYTATVTATNSVNQLTATTLVTITDVPVDGLIVVNDSPTLLGGSTNFTATVTGGTNVSYTWDLGDGNTAVGSTPTHTYPAIGIYIATVTATNPINQLTATTIVTITDVPVDGLIVVNDSPTLLGGTTNFTATVSGGTNVSYTWDLGDGNTAVGSTPSHTYPAIGVYTATVTATNPINQLTATTIVTITDVPVDGLIVVNDSPTTLGDTTNFTATVSGGTNVSYTWDLGDGNTAVGSTPAHIYPAIGIYTATVTATNSVNQLTATTLVTITDVPVAGLTVVNDSPTVLGETTYFTATVSGGTNVTYTWDLGDGNTAVGPTPTHTYPAIGTYTATVTATNSVTQLTATTIITITDVPDEPVAGLLVVNDSPTTLGVTTNFTATVTGGTNVTYTWDLGDGNTAVGSTPTHTYAAIGLYTATVTATNSVSQLTGTTVVTITAVPPTGNSRIYLPLIMRPFAFQLGQASPVQPVATQGAVYYVNTVQIPADLPTGGQYYLSASSSTLAPVVVDDRLILSVTGSPIFSYDFGQPPTGSTIALTADIVAQMAGQTVSVVYQDVYGHQQGATAVWLIWVP